MDKVWQFIVNQSETFGHWLAPHVHQLALVMVVCLVALYGDDLNKLVKRLVGRRHFLIRTAVFVLVTAFGVGALIVFVAPWMAKALVWFGLLWLPVTLFSGFVLLGILAERKNQL